MKKKIMVGIIGTIASAGRPDLIHALADSNSNIYNEIDSLSNNFNSEEVGKSVQYMLSKVLDIEPSLHYDGDENTGVWWVNKDQKGFDYLQVKLSRLIVNFQGVITVTVIVFKNGNNLGYIGEKKSDFLSDALRFLKELLEEAKSYIQQQGLTIHPDGHLA